MTTYRSLVARAGALCTVLLPLIASARGQALRSIPARAASTDTIRSAALLADVDVLRNALLTLHPGIGRYNTSAQIDSIFHVLRERFAVDQTTAAAFLAASEAMSGLQCGHTYLNPLNQSRAVDEAVFRHTPRVPFYFRWIQGTMVVTKDVSAEHAFPTGTQVRGINGVAVATILRGLIPYSRADGNNVPKRIANLDVVPTSRWQAFDVYFPLVFPQDAKPWRFVVRGVDGRPRTISARPTDAEQRFTLFDSLGHAGRDTSPPWTFAVNRDGVGLLTMHTWVTCRELVGDIRVRTGRSGAGCGTTHR